MITLYQIQMSVPFDRTSWRGALQAFAVGYFGCIAGGHALAALVIGRRRRR